MKHIIDKFATHDLFGRENYEYYARVTGRILKVQDEWICSFQHPPPPRGKQAQQKYACMYIIFRFICAFFFIYLKFKENFLVVVKFDCLSANISKRKYDAY